VHAELPCVRTTLVQYVDSTPTLKYFDWSKSALTREITSDCLFQWRVVTWT